MQLQSWPSSFFYFYLCLQAEGSRTHHTRLPQGTLRVTLGGDHCTVRMGQFLYGAVLMDASMHGCMGVAQ